MRVSVALVEEFYQAFIALMSEEAYLLPALDIFGYTASWLSGFLYWISVSHICDVLFYQFVLTEN